MLELSLRECHCHDTQQSAEEQVDELKCKAQASPLCSQYQTSGKYKKEEEQFQERKLLL